MRTRKTVLATNALSNLSFYLYIEATGDVDFDDTIFDSFQVWVNGGGDEGPLKELSEKFAQQILGLTSDLPFDTTEMTDKVKQIKPEFDSMIDEMISNGNDIHKTRAAFGDEKGSIGSISGEKQIEKIWREKGTLPINFVLA